MTTSQQTYPHCAHCAHDSTVVHDRPCDLCQAPVSLAGRTVKKPLTRKRRKRHVENDEYAAFTRRILRAYARRTSAGDIDALADITILAADIDNATRDAVTGLRAIGYSWAEIGARLGVTRQAAQQRWGGNWP
jgi:hypothetical protein